MNEILNVSTVTVARYLLVKIHTTD